MEERCPITTFVVLVVAESWILISNRWTLLMKLLVRILMVSLRTTL